MLKDEKLFSRVFTAIAAFFIPLYYILHLLYFDGFVPHFYEMIIVVGVFVIAFISTFFLKLNEKQLHVMMIALFYLAALYVLYLVYLHDLDHHYVPDLFLILFVGVAIFNKRIQLLICYAILTAGALLISYLTGFPEASSLLMIGIPTIGVLAYFALLFKFRTYDQLTEANARMNEEISKRREIQEFYKRILETTKEGFFITDKEGDILEVNNAYAEMLGYKREELLKTNVRDIDANENTQDVKNRIRRLMKNGGDLFETVHRRKDGSPMDAEVSITYLNEYGGRVFAFVRDTTERKKYEKQIRERTDELTRMNRAMIDRELKMRELKHRLRQAEPATGRNGNNHRIDDEESYWHHVNPSAE